LLPEGPWVSRRGPAGPVREPAAGGPAGVLRAGRPPARSAGAKRYS